VSDHHCHHEENTTAVPACHANKGKPDWLLRVSSFFTVLLYGLHLGVDAERLFPWLAMLAHTVFELINTIWWGVVLGIIMISILGRVPREFVMAVLGTRSGIRGIWRATFAGVLLDLCSHGILMVGAKLYERGASAGQVMAFLVSSPWNSLSLTLILITLIGLPWTLAFIVLSMLVAFVTGLLFDTLVQRRVLPENPQQVDLPENFEFWREAREGIAKVEFSIPYVIAALKEGVVESKMVVRWILFGVLLAAVVRALISEDSFNSYFGPTLMGLGVTLVLATILEVCSEGSTPIAADILNRAGAPGNSFAFLMAGVATDYTEIMVLKSATRSLRTALFLPLLTVPQIFLLGCLLNQFSR